MFANLLTNLIFVSFKPNKSSVTNTCPSQKTDDPIPIVGILIDLVISLAVDVSTHYNTIANTPRFSRSLESLNSCFLSLIIFPLDLNFPLTL